MDEFGILFLATIAALPLAIWMFSRWRIKRADAARAWPKTEAIIETGVLKELKGRYKDGLLPVFTFSYCVHEEYFSGEFALMPYITDPGPSIAERMVGQKLVVCYDPNRPERWFLPGTLIEGCRVQQPMGPYLTSLFRD